MSIEKIWKAFNYLDIGFTEKLFEFMIFKLFIDTNTLDKLEFMKIFDIFNEENALQQYNAYEAKKVKILELEKEEREKREFPIEYKELFDKELGDKVYDFYDK